MDIQSTFRAIVSGTYCLAFLLAVFALSAEAKPEDAVPLPYTYKAKNLKPADFGYQERSWEAVLRKMNGQLAEDPGNADLLLKRAIAYREYGVRRALVLRKRDWKRSRQDFDALLARDSTQADLLYHYALLKRYEGHLGESILMLHRQLAIDRASPHAYVALFRLYYQLVHEKEPAEVTAVVESGPEEYKAFVEAALSRKGDRLREADNRLSSLIRDARGIALQPILLARARVYYSLGEAKIAESFVLQAIQTISSPATARLVLEDFKYILNDQEMRTFFDLEEAQDFQSFFQ